MCGIQCVIVRRWTSRIILLTIFTTWVSISSSVSATDTSTYQVDANTRTVSASALSRPSFARTPMSTSSLRSTALSSYTADVTKSDFDCSNTLRAPLEIQQFCTPHGGQNQVYCSNRKHSFNGMKILAYQKEVPYLSNSTYVTVCLGLLQLSWIHGESSVHMFFNPELAVGVIQMDRACAYTSAKCAWMSTRIREDILSLPLLSLTPRETSFWDFSSPVFRPPFDWFLRFKMREGYTPDKEATTSAAVRALTGTSVRSVMLKGPSYSPGPLFIPTFVNMSQLQILSVSHFLRLNEECFRNTPNIQLLTLNKDFLRKMPSCVEKLKHLIKLTIIHNRIKRLSDVFMRKFDVIEVVLAENEIRSLSSPLPTMPSVLGLFINSCFVKTVDAHSLRAFVNLQSLSLKNNPIMYLSSMAFASLPRLRNLWLDSVHLHTWPVEALRGLKLYQLHMTGNLLTEIPNLKETSIQWLDLCDNQIKGWDDASLFECGSEPAFRRNKSLEGPILQGDDGEFCFNGTWVLELSLINNGIRTLNEAMRTSLGRIREVDLRENKIDCSDCNTPFIQKWIHTSDVKIREPFKCVVPASDANMLVQEITYDSSVCLGPYRKLMSIIVPVCVVAAVLCVGSIVLYVYRTEVAYLRHLIQIRHTSKPDARDNKECVYDAFICYSGRDRKWVLGCLTPLLERAPERYRLCLFDRDFPLGSHIVSNIVDAIDRSVKVVVVLTEHFVSSKWCAWELEMANHKLFGEDRAFLVLLELEPLRRDGLPRLLRFLQDTRPLVRWRRRAREAEAAAAAGQLRRALGPSLHQRAVSSAASETRDPDADSDERTPLVSDVDV